MPDVRRKTEKYDRDSVYRIYDKVEQKWFNYRNFGWRTWVNHAENARFYKRISDAVNSFGYRYGDYGLVISEDRYVVVEFKLVRGTEEVPLVVSETFYERQERERREQTDSAKGMKIIDAAEAAGWEGSEREGQPVPNVNLLKR